MDNRPRVLITATVLSHIAQFHRPLGDLLHKAGYEVHVAGKDNLFLKNGLKIEWADKIFDIDFARSPKSTHNIRAYKQIKAIIDNGDYKYIHCNTPMGGIITRLAAKAARKKGTIVIYTAHGFHFHSRSSKLAWLVYYPIEKYFAKLTDKLITINHEDYNLACKKFCCQTYYTHGVGVNAERYIPLECDDERTAICKELNLSPQDKIILSVGELLPNKNQAMIVRAMKKVVNEVPEARLIIAGNGPMKDNLQGLIEEEGLQEYVKLIGYCTCLEKYQKIASLLAACSYREGLPLNVVEAMLAENPVVASHNRGHDELITDGHTGFLVEPDDYNGMADSLILLLRDDNMRRALGQNAKAFAHSYSSENVTKELQEIYGV